jgi:hypothetical protein
MAWKTRRPRPRFSTRCGSTPAAGGGAGSQDVGNGSGPPDRSEGPRVRRKLTAEA